MTFRISFKARLSWLSTFLLVVFSRSAISALDNPSLRLNVYVIFFILQKLVTT